MNPGKFLAFVTFFLIPGIAKSQSLPNIDFELGNTSVWEFFIGGCCPINRMSSTPAMPNRHTLTSGSGVDPWGFFPIVSPDGGSYSMRLGNDSAHAQSETARYYVRIPSGAVDFSLVYRYAVVLEDPQHRVSEQPRFEVRAYDSLTLGPLPCFQFSFVADSSLPGFYNSPRDTSVRCRGWSTGSINLGGLGGRTVIIDFASGDCSLGQHFGYGYLDMSYGLFAIKTTACNSDSITLQAPPGFNVYSWYDSTTGAFVDTARTIRIHKPAAPLTFKLVLMPYPGYGCPDTLYSTVLPEPKLFHASADTAICPGATARLYVVPEDTATVSYNWSPVGATGCATCTANSVSPKETTTYVITGTNSIGCMKKDTVIVSVLMSRGSSPQDTSICKGDMASLHTGISSLRPPLSYSWAPPGSLSCITCPTPFATPETTTTYTVTVSDAMGCTLKDNVSVTVSGLVAAPKNEIICNGDGVTLSTGLPSTGFTYTWLPSYALNCTDCPTPYSTPTATTTYLFTATDTNGCVNSGNIAVIVDTLILTPVPDTALCINFPVVLYAGAESKAGATVSFMWTPADGLSCSDCVAPLAMPQQTTVYTVTVTDGACIRTDTAKISIDPCDINLPNTFTPNADGNNDIFRVVGHLGYFREFSFSCYNRWGERVFYTENISDGWDGKHKGIDTEIGTYFYMVRYTLYGQKHIMKGDFHLVR